MVLVACFQSEAVERTKPDQRLVAVVLLVERTTKIELTLAGADTQIEAVVGCSGGGSRAAKS